MSRLCPLNPDIDYGPVRDAVRRMTSWEQANKDRIVQKISVFEIPYEPPPVDDETTVTFFEMMDPDVRAVLCLLDARLDWHQSLRAWKVQLTVRGQRTFVYFEGGQASADDWNTFLGYTLTHGHAPAQPLDKFPS
jgi:hypothetical protein